MEIKSLPLDLNKIIIQPIASSWLTEKDLTLDVLRLDLIHPVISGNKWFKLQYYLKEAQQLQKSTVATFGGAYSNHIIATAFACKVYGLESVGIIRGEKPATYSHTLQHAVHYGMKLVFISRDQYKEKEKVAAGFENLNWYWIKEGGYGATGAKGAADILNYVAGNNYTHILASVGTGTMLAGLLTSCLPHQQIIGISSMKGNTALNKEITHLLPTQFKNRHFTLLHKYHFGGYAKHTNELLQWMNEAFNNHNLPLDFVYTAKLFYAICDLAKNNFFKPGSSLLMIHSGGLQGNKSIGQNRLSFL